MIKTPSTRSAKQYTESPCRSSRPKYLSEDIQISERAWLSLARKAGKSKIPLTTLEEVYIRGYYSANPYSKNLPEQQAFNRVNSFMSGGKARELDEDLIVETPKVPDGRKHMSTIKNAIRKYEAPSNNTTTNNDSSSEAPAEVSEGILKRAGQVLKKTAANYTANKIHAGNSVRYILGADKKKVIKPAADSEESIKATAAKTYGSLEGKRRGKEEYDNERGAADDARSKAEDDLLKKPSTIKTAARKVIVKTAAAVQVGRVVQRTADRLAFKNNQKRKANADAVANHTTVADAQAKKSGGGKGIGGDALSRQERTMKAAGVSHDQYHGKAAKGEPPMNSKQLMTIIKQEGGEVRDTATGKVEKTYTGTNNASDSTSNAKTVSSSNRVKAIKGAVSSAKKKRTADPEPGAGIGS